MFKKYKEEDKECKSNKKNLNVNQQLELFKKKQDLLIKKIKHQDIFIKLMVGNLFNDVLDIKVEISLKDFYQTKEERHKNLIEANKQKNRETGNTSANIFNNNYIWNKTISMTLLNRQLNEPEIKLKDIGKFKRLETDEKVHHILSYNPDRVWSKLEIEDELENKTGSYERIRREELLKQVQVFEKLILNKYDINNGEHPKELESEHGFPNFRKYIANGVLRKNNFIPEADINWLSDNKLELDNVMIDELKSKHDNIQKAYVLIILRNKFGHNQLPAKEIFDFIQKLYKKDDGETYSSYFLRIFNQIMREFRN